MAAMTERETWTIYLPDEDCHRTREHVPHVNYEGQTAMSYCSGVGTFGQVTEPSADPFAGIPEDEEF